MLMAVSYICLSLEAYGTELFISEKDAKDVANKELQRLGKDLIRLAAVVDSVWRERLKSNPDYLSKNPKVASKLRDNNYWAVSYYPTHQTSQLTREWELTVFIDKRTGAILAVDNFMNSDLISKHRTIEIANEEAIRRGYDPKNLDHQIDQQNTRWKQYRLLIEIYGNPETGRQYEAIDSLLKDKPFWALHYPYKSDSLDIPKEGDLWVFVNRSNFQILHAFHGNLAALALTQPPKENDILFPPLSKEVSQGKDDSPAVVVPAGLFLMGTTPEERDLITTVYGFSHGLEEEMPQHRIFLDAFYIDQYEVTNSRYAKFLEATGHEAPTNWNELDLAKEGDRPVAGVSWHDADAYCRWAGRRLPTEAEWEKAARGTDGRRYPWGNEIPTNQHANFGYSRQLTPVGSFETGMSPYGVHDLAGNVMEWVADFADRYYYADRYNSQNGPDRNPKGPAFGITKIFRGGSRGKPAQWIRSAHRAWLKPDARSPLIGFRCAKDASK